MAVEAEVEGSEGQGEPFDMYRIGPSPAGDRVRFEFTWLRSNQHGSAQ